MVSLWPGFGEKHGEQQKASGIKAVIFDFDGTLADSLAFAVAKINAFADEYGYQPLHDTQALRLKSLERVIREDLKLKLYQLPGFIKRVRAHISEQEVDAIKVFEGIKDVLERLSKRYLLGVVTSNFPDIVHRILGNAGVSNMSFVYSDSSIWGKHVVFNHLLKTHRFEPAEVVYVGDEVRDIQACKKSGIKTVAVSWGFNARELLQNEQPFGLIDQPLQLLSVL